MPLLKYDLAGIIVSVATLNTAGESRGELQALGSMAKGKALQKYLNKGYLEH